MLTITMDRTDVFFRCLHQYEPESDGGAFAAVDLQLTLASCVCGCSAGMNAVGAA